MKANLSDSCSLNSPIVSLETAKIIIQYFVLVYSAHHRRKVLYHATSGHRPLVPMCSIYDRSFSPNNHYADLNEKGNTDAKTSRPPAIT